MEEACIEISLASIAVLSFTFIFTLIILASNAYRETYSIIQDRTEVSYSQLWAQFIAFIWLPYINSQLQNVFASLSFCLPSSLASSTTMSVNTTSNLFFLFQQAFYTHLGRSSTKVAHSQPNSNYWRACVYDTSTLPSVLLLRRCLYRAHWVLRSPFHM